MLRNSRPPNELFGIHFPNTLFHPSNWERENRWYGAETNLVGLKMICRIDVSLLKVETAYPGWCKVFNCLVEYHEQNDGSFLNRSLLTKDGVLFSHFFKN